MKGTVVVRAKGQLKARQKDGWSICEGVSDIRDATLADECLSSCLPEPRDKQSAELRRPRGVLRQTDGQADDQTD